MADLSPGVAVSCQGLSKRYRVKVPGARRREDFWALDDITFDVGVGEVFGVVGRNGAGKSTLLKVLSRIVQPTRGHALLRGQLAGLLEVGTGFSPELTGRENVYLNGTILGMTRRDVTRQFDSIVDFAGISYFLDTPIKRYSSGMYVRLAFAVAAHLQSEIMVLDEVLAVGDVAFQRKCLGKVQELAHEEGRTVLLVSHNTEIIRENATSAVRLDRGKVAVIGTVQDVLEADVEVAAQTVDLSAVPRIDGNWGTIARITSARVLDGGRLPMGGDLRYQVEVRVERPVVLGVGQAIITSDQTAIATSFSPVQDYEPGLHLLDVCVPTPPLAPGRYGMNLVVGQSSFETPDLHYDGVMDAVSFEVFDSDGLVDWHPEWWGSIALATPQVTATTGG